jgi:hypothetical protein
MIGAKAGPAGPSQARKTVLRMCKDYGDGRVAPKGAGRGRGHRLSERLAKHGRLPATRR